MQKLIITATGLSKSYGTHKAVDDISFSVREGTVFGLLGPNGAGKTTMVRLLNGILRPTGGTAEVMGKDVTTYSDIIRNHCGVQTDTNLYDRLTGEANLSTWGELYGLYGTQLDRRIASLLEMFDLTDKRYTLVGKYSKGMKQKLAIARAVIHNPEILFLDEPTAGLDPEASNDVLVYLKRYVSDAKRTVFLCSHRLEEVETLCSSVAFINKGKLLVSGSVNEIIKSLWRDKYVLVTTANTRPYLVNELNKKGYAFSVEGTVFRIKIRGEQDIPKIIKEIISTDTDIIRVEEEVHTLKDVYFKLIPDNTANQERGV
ncbi:MAG: ABC transporter ATP-binding protein [Elusimicrobiota bacterium]